VGGADGKVVLPVGLAVDDGVSVALVVPVHHKGDVAREGSTFWARRRAGSIPTLVACSTSCDLRGARP
jgi:hypothetical protein